jgi:hypothetical protein
LPATVCPSRQAQPLTTAPPAYRPCPFSCSSPGAADASCALWDGEACGCGDAAAPRAAVEGRSALGADGAAAFDADAGLLVAGTRDGAVVAWRAAAVSGGAER